MANDCPALAPDDPLVRGLLGVVDCNTQQLVHSGYSALFQGQSSFAPLLTVLLTLYVAFIGYRLMLGQSQLRVTEFAVMALKLGAVLALTTQWATYQTVVYRFLFDGPQQLASVMVSSVQPSPSAFGGDVFEGLQRAFDDLSGAANGYSAHVPALGSPLLGGSGLGALMLTVSASILLLSSLGVLLAAKIVLGLLLAMGPLFIALALFGYTRGLFEGWLRASLAFAFAPLATTLLLGVALTMLAPSLLQIEELRNRGVYTLAPVYSVATLILVFAGVSLGALIAGGMIAGGFRLPTRPQPAAADQAIVAVQTAPTADNARVVRVAAAVAAMERRDFATSVSDSRSSVSDRRVSVGASVERSVVGPPQAEVRLGQSTRRAVRPRTPRPTTRSA